ncbi:MAG: YceI family protein [Bacteroidetes bacterium]|nr:YceI family protein [Bacteroidota bacterium]
MKKSFFILLLSVCLVNLANAQKFFTKAGRIDFNATAPSSPETIQAVNRTVTCVLDVANGNMQFAVLIKGFTFERALMQEHFNENYMESDKFPKAEFKGVVSNNATVNYTKNGTYAVTVKGKLTIHGQTNDVEASGKIVVQDGSVNATASFSVLLTDYKVDIPSLVADKVNKAAKIEVACNLEPLKS